MPGWLGRRRIDGGVCLKGRLGKAVGPLVHALLENKDVLCGVRWCDRPCVYNMWKGPSVFGCVGPGNSTDRLCRVCVVQGEEEEKGNNVNMTFVSARIPSSIPSDLIP